MSKLKFYMQKDKKVYTLKDTHANVQTQDAHYKFIKISDAKAKE